MLKETAFKIGVSVSACPIPNAKPFSVCYGSHASKANKWYGHLLNLHGSAFPAFSLSDFYYYMFQTLLGNSMLQCLFSFYSLCPYHSILLSFSLVGGIVLVSKIVSWLREAGFVFNHCLMPM